MLLKLPVAVDVVGSVVVKVVSGMVFVFCVEESVTEVEAGAVVVVVVL